MSSELKIKPHGKQLVSALQNWKDNSLRQSGVHLIFHNNEALISMRRQLRVIKKPRFVIFISHILPMSIKSTAVPGDEKTMTSILFIIVV